MRVAKGRLQLDEFTAPRGARSPIDYFLEELARDQESRAIAIIMSGMGNDGVHGLKTVKECLGLAMAQEPSTAKYDSMPQGAIATGLVDYVAPATALPAKLMAYVTQADERSRQPPFSERTLANNLAKVFMLLRAHTDHDFSLYKQSTIYRRVERRMYLHQLSSLRKYVEFLEANPHEVDLLLKELLIGVTGFFREPESFHVLAEKVLPQLINNKAGKGLRVWVAGCSTGEEAYSLAMIISECAEQAKLEERIHIQIFATDLNKDAVDRARQGFYGQEIEAAVSPEYLRRYCQKEDHGYRVHKRIREMIVFAPQNMIMDPPFTKLDLISCRNVLIYFAAELQRKLLPLFHIRLLRAVSCFWGTRRRSALVPNSSPPSTQNGKSTGAARFRMPSQAERPRGCRLVSRGRPGEN
jgi:two-component system CheB/CheR fusion protein